MVPTATAPTRSRQPMWPSNWTVAGAIRCGGVGLEKDVANSGGRPGDRISLRREGVEPIVWAIKFVDEATGIASIERQQMWRNKWSVTVEARREDRPRAAQDSDLLAAQSQIAVINKLVERALPNDENARQRIMAFARERIAHHLEQGHTFQRAAVSEPVRQHARQPSNKDAARDGERTRTREQDR